MKKLLVIAIGVAFVACGGSGKKPEDTIKAFSIAIAEKNYEEAKKHVVKNDAEIIDMLKMSMEMAEKAGMTNDKMPKKEEVEKMSCECKIDGDKATCKDLLSSGKESIDLIKEGGEWKIVFPKETREQLEKAKQMMEVMKNSGLDNMMNEGMDSLKNMGGDAIKQAMDEANKQLEEIKK